MSRAGITFLGAAALAAGLAAAPAADASGVRFRAVPVSILAINDFHGQLRSAGTFASGVTGVPAIPAGGADQLAGHVAAFRARSRHSIVVSAGDLIGASPLVSALFHDEGTIEAMNRIGLDLNAVGNHEFDEGRGELLRMQSGGCHPTDPNTCKGADVGTPVPFEGAKFRFLAANVVDTKSRRTLFRPYEIRRFDGAPVAFIGMTLEGTPTIVSPSGVTGLSFRDEADTVNALVPELRRQGVEAIVVLLHEGGTVPTAQNAATINLCDGGLAGSPLAGIVSRLDDEVDMVISGHTHQAYNCKLPNSVGRQIPATSANSIGRVATEILLVLHNASGRFDVVAHHANNVVVARNNPAVPANADIAALVAGYEALAQPIANRVIGRISGDLLRATNAAGESVLGDVIADGQLAATAAPAFGGADIAFMNPGGIRADLVFAGSAAGEGDGNVTYGEAFTVQPFGNSLVTMTLTGEQLHLLLEQQFMNCRDGYPATDPVGQPFNRVLQVSAGFQYQWNPAGADCDKVDPATMTLHGVGIDPLASYRVTVNSFLADGGDKFYVLRQGTDRLGGAQDLDALEAYFIANDPVAPTPRDRIGVAP
jgi:5'-nucleotidase